MFLLDTNALSELRKRMPDPVVMDWFARTRTEDISISTVSILELRKGALRSKSALRKMRRDPVAGGLLSDWIDGAVIAAHRDRLLPFDLAVAERCAGLHVPDPRSEMDAMIAATALVHGLTVVTRNVRDFELMLRGSGGGIVNPWEPVP